VRVRRQCEYGHLAVVEPLTFRFSGLGIIVRRIPFTSVTCTVGLMRMSMNLDERRRMRPKMRPLRFGCLAGRLVWNGHTSERVPAPLRSLVLAALLVAAAVSMVAPGAIAERRRQAPLTPATRRGRSPAEGTTTQNPRILGPW
jgi:hypothetical protein